MNAAADAEGASRRRRRELEPEAEPQPEPTPTAPAEQPSELFEARVHFTSPGLVLGGSSWESAVGVYDRQRGLIAARVGERDMDFSIHSAGVSGVHKIRRLK